MDGKKNAAIMQLDSPGLRCALPNKGLISYSCTMLY